ncbi:MAG TPA: hypothetical protein VEK07_22820 [Polyangiaceae bacterium]|nr:hypothetical protein [Polyangiaceae bacterium]
MPANPRTFARPLGALAAVAIGAAGCDPQILVGADPTLEEAGAQTTVTVTIDAGAGPDASFEAGPSLDGSVDAAAVADGALAALLVPWSTGFESGGFGDWDAGQGLGYCYVEGSAMYTIVTSPVHSGQYAAAFSINTAGGSPATPSQARCVRQGILPPAAYYGAWYYVPAAATGVVNWNLLHFTGGDGPDASDIHGLWDVSLTSLSSTSLASEAYDFLDTTTLDGGMAIPIGQWFHLEVFLQPAADGGGAFTLMQNGQVVAGVSGVETADAPWGQWYVGNFASSLSPTTSTVYVDDVTIGTTP